MSKALADYSIEELADAVERKMHADVIEVRLLDGDGSIDARGVIQLRRMALMLSS